MPMPHYPIICYRQGCGQPALYKIAARWSDGITGELKTYALSCEACLPEFFRQSREKQKTCRLTPGEVLEAPNIFRLATGQHDRNLEHQAQLEERLMASEGNRPAG